MGLTLISILLSIGSLFFFGLPVVWLLSNRTDDPEVDLAFAPFIGLGVIVLILQNLVYLNLRVGITTPWLWGAAFLLWIWLARTGRLPSLFSRIPRLLLVVATGVYLVQGLGLGIASAKYYAGSAFIDQYNYTATAQFLADYPFSLTYEQVGNQPYLVKALDVKTDRIGQSVLHAFLATSVATDAKSAFEITILLSPCLVVLAIYLLARRLAVPRSSALLAGGMAGVLPGITIVHLESFLSQALGIPFLLLWPLVLLRAVEQPNWKRILAASLVLATGTSLYTEFFSIFLVVGVMLVGVTLLTNRGKDFSSILYYVLIIGVSLLLNPGFIQGIASILGRISVAGVLTDFYPWAFSVEGLERIWLGDIVQVLPSSWQAVSAIVAVDLIQIAYLGLGILAWQRRNSLALSLLALVCLPLVVFGLGAQYAYQFYKLLLTVSPLFPLGIIWACHELTRILPRYFHVAMYAGLTVLLLIYTTATGIMTGSAALGVGRNEWASTLTSPATRQVQDVLADIRGKDIYISWDGGPFFGAFQNGWLAYFARTNRIWLSNPRVTDINLTSYPSAAQIVDPTDLPDDYLLLASSTWEQDLYYPSGNLVWKNEVYAIWQITEGNWAIIDEIANPNGLEQAQGQAFFWIGIGETQVAVRSAKPGVLTLTADAILGPSLPERNSRTIMVKTDAGFEEKQQIVLKKIQPTPLVMTIPIKAGQNQITIRALDEPTIPVLPTGDDRPLLIGVSGLHITGLAQSSLMK